MRAGWLQVRTPLDRVVAAVLLVVLAPVILGAAAAVRRHDRSPAFIRLRRVGLRGECFDMWKLRTMRAGQASARAGGSSLSAANDKRVTPVGAMLRRCRLDEAPQLLNIVKGEMSLVGPRPEDPRFVDSSDMRWRVVLRQPPGIAGLSQVLVHDWEAAVLATGEREATYRDHVLPVKLAVDHWYATNASPLSDVLIVVALIERFARGRRHTVVHRRVLPRLPRQVGASAVAAPPGPGSTGDSPAE